MPNLLKSPAGMPMNCVTELEQILMFGSWRHWAAVGAASAGLASGVLAAPGYLPAVGPVPLRFRVAAQPVTNLLVIALPSPEPPSAPLDEVIAAPLAASTATNKAPPVAPPSSTVQTNLVPGGPTGANGGLPGAEPLISPQMLLRFFNRSTNGAVGGIIAPVDFAPPAVATPLSSSATYSTDPK
jgi:hypothetical protein